MADQELTVDQARELLDAPSGSRPRIYGTIGEGDTAGQIVSITSQVYLDRFTYSRIWLPEARSISDLVTRK